MEHPKLVVMSVSPVAETKLWFLVVSRVLKDLTSSQETFSFHLGVLAVLRLSQVRASGALGEGEEGGAGGDHDPRSAEGVSVATGTN